MHVLVNAAVSADGKLSTRRREQVAISGPEDFARVETLRADADAVVVGVGTVLADDPHLTVDESELVAEREDRGEPAQPARVVADSRARTPTDAQVLDGAARTIVLVSEAAAPADRREALADAGAEVVAVAPGEPSDDAGAPGPSADVLDTSDSQEQAGAASPSGREGAASQPDREGAASPSARDGTADPTARDGATSPSARDGTADPTARDDAASPTAGDDPGDAVAGDDADDSAPEPGGEDGASDASHARIDLAAGLAALEDRGIDSLLVEGGGELLFSLFEAGLVDELRTFVGPTVIGGRDAPTLADGAGLVASDEFVDLQLRDVERLDGGVALEWTVD